ncbi:hypothetical protein N7448_002956 [Penicillium atrosanguineum]|uniref:Uncharacterized protein n=1 Tax=Penicillium atrosanguineum TaxID=1132637 RepID=A0A9W9H6P2_9EURO|nr:uncharacterized protein N7443_001932 [Penicillium atrosanguineum]KAJ5121825.1 hypothetical protein N7526_008762 [Penicillium atrosanguineum]KAJ5139548.1 hypothetical protein N7448_002956 [Penicillium atrosanguineum]KAJ5309471.1 hypothetical protein N7443_001932 [Penicillium atrosanguineum]KAJ5314990.1 hypothetical protein N7476_005297 [Penicillium atrosanguineum]
MTIEAAENLAEDDLLPAALVCRHLGHSTRTLKHIQLMNILHSYRVSPYSLGNGGRRHLVIQGDQTSGK